MQKSSDDEIKAEADTFDDKTKMKSALMSLLSTIKNEVISDKIFWKYVVLLGGIYIGSRKAFNVFYDNDRYPTFEPETIEQEFDAIGDSSHRPASMILQICGGILNFYYGKQIIFKRDMVLKSDHTNKLTKSDRNFINIHQAIWFIGTILSVLHDEGTKETNILLFLHHVIGLYASIHCKRMNYGGKQYMYWGVWSESVGSFHMIAGLCMFMKRKLFYKSKLLDNLQTLFFMLFLIFFIYGRCISMPKPIIIFLKEMYKKEIKNNKHKNTLYKLDIYILITFSLMAIIMGYYWSFKAISKVVREIKKQT